jgi:hypothetical protein
VPVDHKKLDEKEDLKNGPEEPKIGASEQNK